MPHLGPFGSLVVVAVLALALAPGGTRAQKPDPEVNPHAAALAEFQKRVEAYRALHEDAKSAADLKPTDDPATLRAAQEALAVRIREARADARQGDILTPETGEAFHRLMYPALTGTTALATKAAIQEDAPRAVPLKVNAPYPPGEPRPTVPPNVLANLPKLPAELDYRIVGRHLILHDVDANLIVDYLPDALR